MGKAVKAKATSMKAMKGMKVMKAKRVSIIAKGKRARASVFRGTKVKISGGMTKEAHQEQDRQDRFQGCFSPRQEELRQQRFESLGRCCQGSPQGPEPHWLRCRWRQVGNRQGALCQGQGPAQVNGDLREELLPILGFKGSSPPSWLSRGRTVCRWRMRC